MDECTEKVEEVNNGTLLSRKKEENPVTCWLNILDVMLGEISQSWMNTAWCHLCEASEGVKLTERRVERWLLGPFTAAVCQARWEMSRDLLHNTVLVKLRTLHY